MKQSTHNSNEAKSLPRIWFSDEANFHLNGHVNKQNARTVSFIIQTVLLQIPYIRKS
jgi:hypothetical protein